MEAQILRIEGKTLPAVSKMLAKRGGYVLMSHDINIDLAQIALFFNPHIPNGTQNWLVAPDTSMSNNIEYVLKKIPEPTQNKNWNVARELFENIKIGNGYQFAINPCSIGGLGAYYNNPCLSLYIPSLEFFRDACTEILEKTVATMDNDMLRWRKLKTGITKEDIARMVSYATRDLNEGKVLKKNMQAGIDADVMVGF